MTFEQAIRNQYGKTFPAIPADGQIRKLRLGDGRDGFSIKYEDGGVFGDRANMEAFGWDGEKAYRVDVSESRKVRGLSKKELEFEQTIIKCASGLIATGRSDELSVDDMDRFALAIMRVEVADV